MPELLVELFSEEIPARMQARAAADLARLVNERLLAAGFMPEGVKAFATPRRLALVAAGLPARQPDRREEKKGPRVGAPEKAVEGFLKSAGLTSLDQCETRADKKGEFYVAVIDEKGRDTAAVIAGFMPEIVRAFPWPKSMRWGDGDLRWVRPLKSILCCFDSEIVAFEIDGLKSGDATHGHRFMAPKEIRVRSFEKYEEALASAKVMLDARAREELIAGEAKTLCEAQGLELVDDPGLLAEVAGLAEWPVVMIGGFDEKFLTLPDEVLTASMRGHQKYFSVRDPKTGRLAPKFVFAANIEASDGGKAMRAGYERVLTARLSDAWFLYRQDLKTPLEDRIADLDRVMFFEGLGSVGDKARRVAALAREIAPSVGADPQLAEEAALVAKVDLVTGMVYEFPELQGVMGRYYYLAQHAALRDGPAGPPQGEGEGGVSGEKTHEAAQNSNLHPESDRTGTNQQNLRLHPEGDRTGINHRSPLHLEGDWMGTNHRSPLHPEEARSAVTKDARAIADAIRDHYKPQGAGDDVPTDPVTIAVALADKIDTLTAFWAIDKKPTGSSDPFALRRAALGVIITTQTNSIRIPLCALFQVVPPIVMTDNAELKNLKFAGGSLTDTVKDDLLAFFHDRLKVYLRDKGHRHDRIDAVLTAAGGAPEDDLVLIVMKLEALEAFLETDDGANLAAAYKRAANILKAEQKKGDLPGADDVAEAALAEPEEKALYAALVKAEAAAKAAVAAEKFADAMTALAALRAPLDAFFEKVTVNAEDPALRQNRLALLERFRAATATAADLSKLEG